MTMLVPCVEGNSRKSFPSESVSTHLTVVCMVSISRVSYGMPCFFKYDGSKAIRRKLCALQVVPTQHFRRFLRYHCRRGGSGKGVLKGSIYHRWENSLRKREGSRLQYASKARDNKSQNALYIRGFGKNVPGTLSRRA